MEILSPAGGFEALKAAVFNGADAVYAGGKLFSARKSAANFDNEELLRAIDFCHLFGVKLYVAVNILIKESEMKEALSFLEFVREAGADGVIIQDLGLIAAAKRSFDDLKINASTQMTVHSSNGVKILEKLGANRVVLSREVSLEEIKKIKEKTTAELEVFVHGALCMSYSGQCLMSSIIGARSGNRGACAQPCRLNYRLFENEKEITKKPLSLLSPKDLCLISHLGELEKAGVTSLKIEGRMKSPEYVGMVTKAYSDTLKYGLNEEEAKKMLAAFSRGGSSTGYFYGRAYKSMMDYEGGAKINKAVLAENKEKAERKIPIEMQFKAQSGEKISLVAICGGKKAEVLGETAQKAEKVALSAERAEAQLKKLGETEFFAEKIICDIKEGTAVPVKAINEIRREAVLKLKQELAKDFKRKPKKSVYITNELKPKNEEISLTCECLTAEQAKTAWELGITRIFVPIALKEKLNGSNDFIYTLPSVLKDTEELDLKGIEKICVQNIGELIFSDKEIYAGHRMNCFNGGAVRLLEDMGVKSVVLSPELNFEEINRLVPYCKNRPEVIAYGRLPLMLTENCFVKSVCGVCKKGKNISIKDRIGERFPVICENCRNVILNSKVIFMADKIRALKKAGADLRLMFTVESAEETEKIILLYKSAVGEKSVQKPDGGFTRGHFLRGVE